MGEGEGSGHGVMVPLHRQYLLCFLHQLFLWKKQNTGPNNPVRKIFIAL